MSTVSGSSTVNGLYSNPNQISGLVSGLDTESMIEGLVSSYNAKVTGYQQQVVMKEWEQEAYRDVITQLMNFTAKYTSFTNSGTNLLSSAFFGSATTTTATGSMSDAVSVTGTTSSSVEITNVLALATTSRYESSVLSEAASSEYIQADSVDLSSAELKSTMSGTITLGYGGSSTVSIKLTDDDVITGDTDAERAQSLADIINSKLKDATVTVSGSTNPADQYIEASVNADGELVINDINGSGGNGAFIKTASSSITNALGWSLDTSTPSNNTTLSMANNGTLSEYVSGYDTISGQDIRVEYNGTTKTFTMPSFDDITYDASGNATSVTYDGTTYDTTTTDGKNALNQVIVDKLDAEVQSAFGGSVTVSNTASDGTLALNFNIENSGANTLSTWSSVGEDLGLGETATNYVNTSTDLGTLLSKLTSTDPGFTMDSSTTYNVDDGSFDPDSTKVEALTGDVRYMEGSGNATYNSTTGQYTDSNGDRVVQVTDTEGTEMWVKVNEDGELRTGAVVEINGTEIGVFDEDSTLSNVISAINSSGCGVNATFSTLTNSMVFTASESGTNSQIEIGGSLGIALFGEVDKTASNYTAGTNALMVATVNGQEVVMERSSNTFEIDGLSVTANELFNNTTEDGTVITTADSYAANKSDIVSEGTIGFKEETDVSALVDVITEMVDDYNNLLNNIRSYFTTQPLTTTTGSSYLPLTDDEASSMSESAIENYETRAKTGILYGDSNMRNLYNSLSTAFSAAGPFGSTLTAMGFDVTYGTFSADGEVVSYDKDKITSMLTNNLEEVKSAFISTTTYGGANGLMTSLKSTMEQYGSTTGSTKGILVNAAGSELSSLSLLDNTMQKKIDALNALAETWEQKLADKVIYYTSKFSALEVLMSEANSQMSSLSALGTS